MRSEFNGNIAEVRAMEDVIRATKKYTEGLGTIRKHHPAQGEDFASKVFTKCYEIYPDIVVGLDMPVFVAIDWLWADTTCINVRFWYDYRSDEASFKIIGGDESLRILMQGIPGLLKLLQMTAADADESKALAKLAKTTTAIVEPADMDEDAEAENEPEQRIMDRLLPSRKKVG